MLDKAVIDSSDNNVISHLFPLDYNDMKTIIRNDSIS